MNFLLDTNVVSEWVKPNPDAKLVKWLAQAKEDHVFISVITLAELRRGTARIAQGRRRSQLETWLQNDLPQRFNGRILTIDAAVADAWGELVAERDLIGRPIAAMDAFIAAITRVHDLTLVTRNVADFSPSLKKILNPWGSRRAAQ